ncbi:hypothetical protein AMECASPLE_002932 [Ameca splendens]|uniref:Uncharacterized protein n=1 Tax=Ameca splendens TaxID=208324 RepID=A0ABV0Z7A3_9TELE
MHQAVCFCLRELQVIQQHITECQLRTFEINSFPKRRVPNSTTPGWRYLKDYSVKRETKEKRIRFVPSSEFQFLLWSESQQSRSEVVENQSDVLGGGPQFTTSQMKSWIFLASSHDC